MKLIYREKQSGTPEQPYVMVAAFFPVTLENDMPYDFPAIIATEIGDYRDDENARRTFVMIRELDQPQVIRQAIKILDETYAKVTAEAKQHKNSLDPRD